METPLVVTLVRSARYVYGLKPHVLPRRPGLGPMEELCLRYGLPVVTHILLSPASEFRGSYLNPTRVVGGCVAKMARMQYCSVKLSLQQCSSSRSVFVGQERGRA